ncbi:MAG: tetratricopeptide repeat protein [Pseudomonadota bacterium]
MTALHTPIILSVFAFLASAGMQNGTALAATFDSSDDTPVLTEDGTLSLEPVIGGSPSLLGLDGALQPQAGTVFSADVRRAMDKMLRENTLEAAEAFRSVLGTSTGDAAAWGILSTWAADNQHSALAVEALEMGKSLNAEDGLVRLGEAAVLMLQDRNIEAQKVLYALFRSAPEKKSVMQRLLASYFETGSLTLATSVLSQHIAAVGSVSGTTQQRYQLAQIYRDIGSYKAAQGQVDVIVRATSPQDDLRRKSSLLGAEIAIRLNDHTRAQDYLDLITSWSDDVTQAALLRAVVEYELRKSEQAIRQLEQLADDRDVGADALAHLGTFAFKEARPIAGARQFSAAIDRSSGVEKINHLQTFLELLDDAGLEEEGHAALRDRLDELGVLGHIMLTDRLIQKGKLAEAEAAATTGFDMFPSQSEIAYLRGIARFQMGKAQDAEADFRAATELNARHTRAWVSLAKLLHERGGHGGPGQHIDVIATYERALEQSPNNAVIQIELGKVAQEEGRRQDAETWYRRALKSAPGDPIANSLLAILFAETGALDAAVQFADAAHGALPEHFQTNYAKGRVAYHFGEFIAASEYLLAANAAMESHGHSLAFAASAFEQLGNRKAAVKQATRALELALSVEETELVRNVLSATQGDASGQVAIRRIGADGVHETAGRLSYRDSQDGLVLELSVDGLQAGDNAVHFHENPSCEPARQNGVLVAGFSAGEHLGASGAPGGHNHNHAAHAQASASAGDGAMPMTAVSSEPDPNDPHAQHKMNMAQASEQSNAQQAGSKTLSRDSSLPIGDLPMLFADANGFGAYELLIPYLHSSILDDRSLVIHHGIHARRAFCGVIER